MIHDTLLIAASDELGNPYLQKLHPVQHCFELESRSPFSLLECRRARSAHQLSVLGHVCLIVCYCVKNANWPTEHMLKQATSPLHVSA